MKKIISVLAVLCLCAAIIAGCGNNNSAIVRIGSLKGPTSIGLVGMMDKSENGETKNNYTFEMAAAADEILPKMISGELDIALVPANVASILYNKTSGGIKVIDINTLGVLYAVSGDSSINSIEKLKGKTIYIPNKGTTPDYVMSYLMNQNGLEDGDVNVEYKSEATEVAAMLKEHPDAVGILPQPFVTACCIQNSELSVVLNLTEEWDKCNEEGSRLVTGVTVVRKAFLDENEKAVKVFMEEHKSSAEGCNSDIDTAASLVVKTGIIEKEPVAKRAIPECNITYIDGKEMKEALSGYLKVLFDLNTESVGGSLPDEEFYY